MLAKFDVNVLNERSTFLIREFFCFFYYIHEVVVVSATWICSIKCFKFVPDQREIVYEYIGGVSVEAQAPWDEINKIPPLPTGWKVRGTFKLQRIDANTLAAAVSMRYISNEHSKGKKEISEMRFTLLY